MTSIFYEPVRIQKVFTTSLRLILETPRSSQQERRGSYISTPGALCIIDRDDTALECRNSRVF